MLWVVTVQRTPFVYVRDVLHVEWQVHAEIRQGPNSGVGWLQDVETTVWAEPREHGLPLEVLWIYSDRIYFNCRGYFHSICNLVEDILIAFTSIWGRVW